jgi:hypothetical protein
MALLGNAALAMWWEVATDQRGEFEDWHSHEHLHERMRITGFNRGSRWASLEGGEGFFVLYELEDYATLTSPQYMARLNDPTPWSVKMMPNHRGMVRSQCRVEESFGGGLARVMMTLRISPRPEQARAVQERLRIILGAVAQRPGLTGGHLLRTDTPDAPTTAEQRIRGGDAIADWIVLISGYDAAALNDLASGDSIREVLNQSGNTSGNAISLYALSFSMTPGDL